MWLLEVVVDISEHPRSYTIQAPEGQTYRHNRVHLRPDTLFRNNSDDEDDSHSDEGREDNLSDSGSTVEPDTSASVTISAPTELRRSK